jgi:hypothetical protein
VHWHDDFLCTFGLWNAVIELIDEPQFRLGCGENEMLSLQCLASCISHRTILVEASSTLALNRPLRSLLIAQLTAAAEFASNVDETRVN